MSVRVQTLKEVTVSIAGQRVQVSTTPLLVYSATIQSVYTNTGYQYVGDSTVSSSNGHIFEASDVMEIEGPPAAKGAEQFDLSEIYLDSSTAGAKFRISAWIRK